MRAREWENLIGRTPLVLLKRLGGKATILAKCEWFNPGGSVKDRAALFMLKEALASGKLAPGGTVVEPTSGNTGIALAWLSRRLELQVVITMPENMSRERVDLLTAYGAKVVLTPAEKGLPGAVEAAKELVQEMKGAFMPDQFSNPANAEAHYRTTGPEIWEDTEGRVDIVVAGVGTGGTLTGIARYLKERKPEVQVVAVEPAESPVLSGGKPGRHGIQGIGAGFVPPLLARELIDEVILVTTAEAVATCRELAAKEGILAGLSSGAACRAALKLASRPENRGKVVVVIFPDSGERYISLGLWRKA
ncbi:cysteine synthase [Ammonifex degensii KC4]|uniref:Cysteine synthase n=1 Tax=Ammonifex degensii (strain DSM 10501 / KC4) TaxID=429009 RepID=C9RAQ7_AMMDK|nr:cysteine synthase A [Ammonifex degensii]ACX51334.1 cysteine synthase [Ammonifex degensii KC4]